LLLMPTFSWNSIAYLTHTNLLCALCLATFHTLLRIVQDGKTASFWLLGLLLGGGMLAKYNYVVFAGALAVSTLTIPQCRPKLLDRRLMISIGLAGIMVLPHFLWLADHWQEIGQIMAMKTGIGQAHSHFQGAATGIWELVLNTFLILTPLWLFLIWFFPAGFSYTKESSEHSAQPRCLLGRFFLAAAILLLLSILVEGISHIHERWLQPFLLLVPVYYFVRLSGVGIAGRRLRGYAFVLTLFALAVLAGRTSQFWLGGATNGGYPLDISFSEAAKQMRAAGFQEGTIIAGDRVICGNLRLCFPQARLVCCKYPPYLPPARPSEECLLVWNSQDRNIALPIAGDDWKEGELRQVALKPKHGHSVCLKFVILRHDRAASLLELR
jgi:hypothetical protein